MKTKQDMNFQKILTPRSGPQNSKLWKNHPQGMVQGTCTPNLVVIGGYLDTEKFGELKWDRDQRCTDIFFWGVGEGEKEVVGGL